MRVGVELVAAQRAERGGGKLRAVVQRVSLVDDLRRSPRSIAALIRRGYGCSRRTGCSNPIERAEAGNWQRTAGKSVGQHEAVALTQAGLTAGANYYAGRTRGACAGSYAPRREPPRGNRSVDAPAEQRGAVDRRGCRVRAPSRWASGAARVSASGERRWGRAQTPGRRASGTVAAGGRARRQRARPAARAPRHDRELGGDLARAGQRGRARGPDGASRRAVSSPAARTGAARAVPPAAAVR
jgi:hypothetical protein